MEEASAALKLDGWDGDDAGSLVAVGAAGAAAGMGIASTFIGVPRDRLHSMRQLRGVDLGMRRRAAMAGISETYTKLDGSEGESGTVSKAQEARVARCIPAKSIRESQPGKVSRDSNGAIQLR